jgi:hypothetical protein
MPTIDKKPGTIKQAQVSEGPLALVHTNHPQSAPASHTHPRLAALTAAIQLAAQTLLAALIVETIAVATLGTDAGTTIALLTTTILLASKQLASTTSP